jgi:hypothetical protein
MALDETEFNLQNADRPIAPAMIPVRADDLLKLRKIARIALDCHVLPDMLRADANRLATAL